MLHQTPLITMIVVGLVLAFCLGALAQRLRIPPLAVLATLFIIAIGKSLAAFAIVRLFGYPNSTALTISASLAQIGEFSFILAGLGVSLALLPERGRDLILAGATLSILLNPLFFALLDRWHAKREAAKAAAAAADVAAAAVEEPARDTQLTGHVVLVGHGRVGSYVSTRLREAGASLLVIEDQGARVARLVDEGGEAISGNAADPNVIGAANLGAAQCLLVAIPDAFEGGQVVEQARAINASLPIIARAHSEAEDEHLKKHGATLVIMGEHEIAKAMIASIPPVPASPEGARTEIRPDDRGKPV